MRLVVGILIFVVVGLATGLALDGWMQLAEIEGPMETYVHPKYGPSYYPNLAFSRFHEGFFLGGTNHWGFLGEGRVPRNENGELRVALVGDSFVLGHTVFERHHFKRVLEADLEAALGRPVVVLNFARADFNLLNMHRYYRDVVSQWDHDIALLFAGEADFMAGGQIGSALYPVTVASGDSVSADYSFRSTSLYRRAKRVEPVTSRLAVARLGFNVYKLAVRGRLPHILLDKLAPSPRVPDAEDGARQDPGPRPLPDGSRAVLIDLAADSRVQLVYKGPVNDVCRTAVADSGLQPFDLEPVFRTMRAEGVDPRWWPITRRLGHWNHAAHVAIGHALARDLLAGGLVGDGDGS